MHPADTDRYRAALPGTYFNEVSLLDPTLAFPQFSTPNALGHSKCAAKNIANPLNASISTSQELRRL
jgi:hypothetical protein